MTTNQGNKASITVEHHLPIHEEQTEPSKRPKLDNSQTQPQEPSPSNVSSSSSSSSPENQAKNRKMEHGKNQECSSREVSDGEDSPSEALELTFSWRDSTVGE
jgi:hypothetical protein